MLKSKTKYNYSSKIAIGSAQFGLDYGISNWGGVASNEEVIDILDLAKQSGIDTIDTAQAYGNSESVLGKLGMEEWKIISKFNSNENLRHQFFMSLKKLKVKKLYGYIAHSAQILITTPKLWHDLVELKEEGFVNKIGYSIYSPNELKSLLALNFKPDIVQLPYNILDRRFEPYFSRLKEYNVEIHVRSVFLQGLFFSDSKKLPDFFNPIKNFLEQFNNKYLDNQKKAEKLLALPLYNKNIDKVVLGVNTRAQLEMNISSMNQSSDTFAIKIPIVDEKILLPYNWPSK